MEEPGATLCGETGNERTRSLPGMKSLRARGLREGDLAGPLGLLDFLIFQGTSLRSLPALPLFTLFPLLGTEAAGAESLLQTVFFLTTVEDLVVLVFVLTTVEVIGGGAWKTGGGGAGKNIGSRGGEGPISIGMGMP